MEWLDDYQRALIFRMSDRRFMQEHAGLIRTLQFDPLYADLVKDLLSRQRRGQVLSRSQLRQLARKHQVKLVEDDGDIDFDRETILKVWKYQSFRRAVEQVNKLGDEGRYEDAISVMKGLPRSWPVQQNGRINILDQVKPLEARKGLISTGLPTIDSVFYGGLGAGEVGMIMAPTSGGKTSLLVWLACHAARNGHRVHYITLEVPSREIIGKARCCFTQDGKPSLHKWVKVARMLKRSQGRMEVEEYPPRTVSMAQIEGCLQDDTDMLLIDYADYLRPPNLNMGITYEDLGAIYVELKRVAMERSITVWTASQVNRSSYERSVHEVQAVEASLKKAMVTDVALSLSQEPEDRETDKETGNSRGYLYVAKNRHGPRFDQIKVTMHFSTCGFREGHYG